MCAECDELVANEVTIKVNEQPARQTACGLFWIKTENRWQAVVKSRYLAHLAVWEHEREQKLLAEKARLEISQGPIIADSWWKQNYIQPTNRTVAVFKHDALVPVHDEPKDDHWERLMEEALQELAEEARKGNKLLFPHA